MPHVEAAQLPHRSPGNERTIGVAVQSRASRCSCESRPANVPGDQAATRQTNHPAGAERRFGPTDSPAWFAGGRWGDHRLPAWNHHTDRRKWRQAFVRRARCRSRFRSSRWIAGKARSRETTCTLFDSGNAIADRHHRSRRRWELKDLANGGIAATAELASVERCSAPATRPPQTAAPPPRSLPAWSDVQSRLRPFARLHVESYRRPRASETSPHPDKPGWWRGSGRRTPGLVLNTAPRWQAPWWPSGPGGSPRRTSNREG